MDVDGLAEPIGQLISAAPQRERRWLARLLLDPASYEAYTGLDNELFLRREGDRDAVLVASAAAGEGRTTIALMLAVMSSVAARTRRVLLVDADVSGGRLATMLGVPPGPGLAELFNGEATPDRCIHPTAIPNLWLTPRAAVDRGQTPFSARAFESYIEHVRSQFDRVVVDTPARRSNATVLSMASIVKTAILVVRYAGPTREQVSTLLAELQGAGARVLGGVLNEREFVVPGFLYGGR